MGDEISAFTYRMFIEPIETRLVDEIDHRLVGPTQVQHRSVGFHAAAVILHTQDGAEMDGFHRVAYGMASHGELFLSCYDVMGKERREPQTNVDGSRLACCEVHGNDSVGV